MTPHQEVTHMGWNGVKTTKMLEVEAEILGGKDLRKHVAARLDAGDSVSKIARDLDTTTITVNKWIEKFEIEVTVERTVRA
jgi:hypothetical protein